jgi:hypothetical protein
LATLTGAHFRNLHVAFKIPCVYAYINKIRTKQAEIIKNNLNPNAHAIGQEEAKHKSIRGLNLEAVKPTNVQMSNCSLEVVK